MTPARHHRLQIALGVLCWTVGPVLVYVLLAGELAGLALLQWVLLGTLLAHGFLSSLLHLAAWAFRTPPY